MKIYLLILSFFTLMSMGLMAETIESSTDKDLAMSVINSDSSVNDEVINLFKSELKNENSKISKKLTTFRTQLIEAKSHDLILLNKVSMSGNVSAEYILPVRIFSKTTISTIAYISVLHMVDMESEELGLANKIYLMGFASVEMKIK